MGIKEQVVAPPSDDKRWQIINVTMRKHGYQPDALIETLHKVQETLGFLDDASLHYVSESLSVPLSKAYGVATFYHYFTLKPAGQHSCVVCNGTSCYIKGAAELIDAVQETYGIGMGETTEDKQLSMLGARCVGACGLAPTAVLDGEMIPKLTPELLIKHIQRTIEDGLRGTEPDRG